MKIKRFGGIFFVCLFSVIWICFAGCSARPVSTKPEPQASIISESSTPAQSAEPVEYTASSEIENAALYSNALQIGNTVFSKPPQYSDFINAGAVLATKDITENFLINPGEKKTIELQIESTVIRINIKNDNDKPCALKDAKVGKTLYSNGPEVFFPMGLRVGNSLPDLIEKWGEPSIDESKSSDKMLIYQYLEYPINLKRVISSLMGDEIVSATGVSYTVTIDRDTSQIASISCKGFDKSLAGSIEDVIKEVKYSNGDTYDLTFEIPFEFWTNIVTLGGTAMTTYVVDNVPYVFVLDTNTLDWGHFEGEVSETDLKEAINPKHASLIYEVDKIETNGMAGMIMGYSKTDEGYQCTGIYRDVKRQYSTRESLLIPLNENGEVSAAALSKFKEIMTSFMDSVSISEKQGNGATTSIAAPTPSPNSNLEADSILGSWTLIGSYDPEKWGWDLDKTKPLPEEKIDKTEEPYTMILKENILEDGNSGEIHKVEYDKKGTTADVEDTIFWQFILVDSNQLFELYGDTLSVYMRTK